MEINSTYKVIMAITLMIVTMAGCEKMLPSPVKDNEILSGTIDGLTQEQIREHITGDENFSQVFTPEQGLGPIFVQASCSNCHVGNGKGDLNTALTRFAKVNDDILDSLYNEGGPQLQQNFIPGYLGGTLPPDANVFSKRVAPVVMGQGFIAALSDASILANADPNDLDADGISGRPNYVSPTGFFVPQSIHVLLNGQYIGRFGKKALKVTLQDQVVLALNKDIGITSDYDPHDSYNYLVGMNTGDHVPDPEVSSAFVNSLVFYVRTLKVPPRRNAYDPDVISGEQLFNVIGCTGCHKSTFVTAQSDISALSNQTFHPYSDFLLHDMGQALDDGYPEGSAKSSEWRTAPLWGAGLAGNSQGGRLFLLHDGRATSFEQAISYHGGEAAGRKDVFFSLPAHQQQQIIKFLKSL